MCLFFLYRNPRPAPGAFRLVLAFNRDEFLSRPTRAASWGDGGDGDGFLGGRDLHKGREGGTWLGVDAAGRLAMLTNIFTGGPPDSEARGRGWLVPEFLGSKVPAAEFAGRVVAEGQAGVRYNPFNLCLLEMDDDSGGAYRGTYLCRGKEKMTEGPRAITEDFFGLGNHPASAPFNKTRIGLDTFKQIVGSHADTSDSSKASLVRELTDMMRDRTTHHPDAQAARQAQEFGNDVDSERLKGGTAVYVDVLDGVYGTRAQTIVLVDYEKNVFFVEKSREGTSDWTEKQFQFKIKDSS